MRALIGSARERSLSAVLELGGVVMRRRDFISILGGAAVLWPLGARGQQSAMPLVGFLRSQSRSASAFLLPGLVRGLKEAGFIDGENVSIEYRYAEGLPDRLPELVAELINRPVAVIVANVVAAAAAKAATTRVPIILVTGSDPVADGFVTSLNRPGGNITAVSFISGALGAKRLEMLRQLVPRATTTAMIVEEDAREAAAERAEVETAAQHFGLQLMVVPVNRERDFAAAFGAIVASKAGALLVGAGPILTSHREQIVALASQHGLPAFYSLREFVAAGGLMSYGASITDAYRQAGVYAGRILKGEKPGDLPVMQASKFEFVINLKTAKLLGITIPPTLLALADEVIE